MSSPQSPDDGDGGGDPSTGGLKRSFEEFNLRQSGSVPHQNKNTPKRLRPSECSSYLNGLIEVAKGRNTIAVLATVEDRTNIVAMLIDEFRKVRADKKSGDRRKLIVFLATEDSHVIQQCEMIKACTNLRVKELHGLLGADGWKPEFWKEIPNYHVLVMTPQILLAALRKALLSIEAASLLIIDECHQATGNQHYSLIMKDFYHRSIDKPKIFGMTASAAIRKGCDDQISALEQKLDSLVFTNYEKRKLPMFTFYRFYDPAKGYFGLEDKLKLLFSKYDALLKKCQESPLFHNEDIEENKMEKRLFDDYEQICYCLSNLGIICAYEAVRICVESIPTPLGDSRLCIKNSSPYKSFLGEALTVIKEFLPQGSFTTGELIVPEIGYGLATDDVGFISPKVIELMRIIQHLGEDDKHVCLVFVERIITVKVIERLVRSTSLTHFTVSHLTESGSSAGAVITEREKGRLPSFDAGKVYLLFTSAESEEGIHIPDCSYVICFDLPKAPRSYVQLCGQAHQSNCPLVMMHESNNQPQQDQLYHIIRSEKCVVDAAVDEDAGASELMPLISQQLHAFIVEATGASVASDSCVGLLHHYCEKLPSSKYCNPKPIFKILHSGCLYECEVTLPSNAAFETIIGPLHSNAQLSKQLACLEACKKLHQMGALDDHLLPNIGMDVNKGVKLQTSESILGAGTTKRKELHGTAQICSLYGTWRGKASGATYHAYRIDFSCNIARELYSSFVLLTESSLDDDVATAKVDLYMLSQKVVASSIFSCGQASLDAGQITRATCFHELFFNGLFGKLYKGRAGKKEFLLKKENDQLWRPSYLYLILPLESSDICNPESWSIDWKGIDSCLSVVEFMKKFSELSSERCGGNNQNLAVADTTERKHFLCTDTVYLANDSVPVNEMKNAVVTAIHTGKMYSVVKIVPDSSSESPFDGNSDSENPKYSTFAEYYFQKYGILLSYPGQPLLLLKQSHNAHNLLVDFKKEGVKKLGSCKLMAEKPQNYVFMPPELVVKINVPVSVLKASYLLPSLMHRLESLMLAGQLRQEIGFKSVNSLIPSSLILEALTTSRCCEAFSLERLELLGDSVLKYAVSCHLFHQYPEQNEGKLSALRSSAVCNATLHKLGIKRKIQGYIRDTAFEPRRWIAPGQASIHPVPCTHGLDTLDVPQGCSKFMTNQENVKVGKNCDKGHRWMCSKTIADCVEALIGAYFVAAGLTAAAHFMNWLGIEVNIEPNYLNEAINRASLHCYTPKSEEIESLEAKLGYEFCVKGLLLEAITHASEEESAVEYCYQRLEFLGDSVLDLLITWHLYQAHVDIDPGELTDLRSASVNNDSFALVSVRRNLYPHLQSSSEKLLSQIREYERLVMENENHANSLLGQKGPKALGDLVESIAGAVLLDTKLSLNEVWRVFEPLLSPIVTPETLELPPHRELVELCAYHGYFIKEQCFDNSDLVHAELRLQLEDVLLIGEGIDRTKKAARGQAATHLLRDLQKRGITCTQCATKRKKQESQGDGSPSSPKSKALGDQMLGESSVGNSLTGKLNKAVLPLASSGVPNNKFLSTEAPVVVVVGMRKGGPRSSLYELCKKFQWPMPTFQSTKLDSRSQSDLGEDTGVKKGADSFVSIMSLQIPDVGVMEVSGDQKPDKKSSLDSAALLLLHQLENKGIIRIEVS